MNNDDQVTSDRTFTGPFLTFDPCKSIKSVSSTFQKLIDHV